MKGSCHSFYLVHLLLIVSHTLILRVAFLPLLLVHSGFSSELFLYVRVCISVKPSHATPQKNSYRITCLNLRLSAWRLSEV